MKPPSPAEVGEALRRYVPMDIPALPGRTNHLRAAVVIPLLWRAEIEVVLTVRTTRLRQHAGEVCFPGGPRLTRSMHLGRRWDGWQR